MRTNDIGILIFVGDHVLDNTDEISEIRDHGDGTASVHMVDGGVMSLDEIQFDDIHLESEIRNMRLADDLREFVNDPRPSYTLVLFDRHGRECYRGPKTRDTTRPALGASYLIAPDTELKFKPYRRDPFAADRRVYLSPSRRPYGSNAEKIAAAKRFSLDGEENNALAMLALLK
jgi:hypothetical protein